MFLFLSIHVDGFQLQKWFRWLQEAPEESDSESMADIIKSNEELHQHEQQESNKS